MLECPDYIFLLGAGSPEMMALSSFSAPPDLIMLADDIAVEQSISRSAVFRQAFLYWIQREHPAKWKEIADV